MPSVIQTLPTPTASSDAFPATSHSSAAQWGIVKSKKAFVQLSPLRYPVVYGGGLEFLEGVDVGKVGSLDVTQDGERIHALISSSLARISDQRT